MATALESDMGSALRKNRRLVSTEVIFVVAGARRASWCKAAHDCLYSTTPSSTIREARVIRGFYKANFSA
jgi:hypothetical protein